MKKFFLLTVVFVAAMMINLPISHAKQIRFVDVSVENFVNQVKQHVKSSDGENVIISNLRREKEWDVPILGLTGWICDFYMADNSGNRGWLIIFTDSEGYVSMVRIASLKTEQSAKSSSYVMVAVWHSISLTLDEMAALLKNGKTWSSYNNRFYVISREEDKLVVSLQHAEDS